MKMSLRNDIGVGLLREKAGAALGRVVVASFSQAPLDFLHDQVDGRLEIDKNKLEEEVPIHSLYSRRRAWWLYRQNFSSAR